MKAFIKIFFLLFALNALTTYPSFSAKSYDNFDHWLSSFKILALKQGISEKTLKIVLQDVEFLEQVIKYDRRQPEFFEDTITYVSKRATKSRATLAKKLYNKNNILFNEVENNFNVEKEILLSLWGIETNFGKYVGKMDIISSLATLSYDERRRDFFTKELIILLKLIDKRLIDHKTLYGSWAGAFGNFQFMPSTIERYALDYDKNNKIELKTSLHDALASAANYIYSIGWKKGQPCYLRVKLNKDINKKYINTSAKKISYKLKNSKWKKLGVSNFDGSELQIKYKAALIQPDGKINTPTFLVFDNYEKILKWNRSLRFGISVCKLANMIIE